MTEDKKPFTVSDRRHFTPSGEARESSGEEGKASPEPADDTAGTLPPPTSAPPKVTFAGFLLGLGTQAAALLQPPPHDEDAGDARALRLEEVRHVIAILEMLKDRTEGRRTAEEEQILASLLYELRMSYLDSTRAGKA